MAIVEIPGGGVYFPPPILCEDSGVPAFETYTLDTTTRKIAFVFPIPKSTTLDRFEFGTRTVTQAPANGLKISFQDVASGVPDGTATYFYVQTSGLTTNSWITTLAITDDGTDTGNRKVVSRGDFLACVIEFESFSLGDSLQIAVLTQGEYSPRGPYVLTHDGAWTKVSGLPCLALADQPLFSGYIPVPGTYPVFSAPATSIEMGGDPDEKGLEFQFASPVRIGGGYALIEPFVDFDVILYDIEANEEMTRVSISRDNYFNNALGVAFVEWRFLSDPLINPNQSYVMAILPTDNADIIDLYGLFSYGGLEGTNQTAAMPMGNTWFLAARTGGGDWNRLSNVRPLMGVLVTGLDHEISGGSSGPGWEGNP